MLESEINSLVGNWESLVLTMDSGAGNNVAPRDAFPWAKLEPNDDSRAGKYYLAANGKKVYVLGEKVITMKMEDGVVKRIRFQIADVTRILVSVGKVTKAGNQVVMEKKGGKVIEPNGRQFNMEMENGVYIMKCWVKTEGNDSRFPRPAQ